MRSSFGSVIAVAVIAGCGSSGTPVTTSPIQGHAATPAPDAMIAGMGQPPAQLPRHEVALTAKVPVVLSNGVTLTLVTVLEAHITDRNGNSGNELTCLLEVRKGQAEKSITLTRVTTSSEPTGESQELWGVRLSLLMVDAYHQPATASLLVAP